MHSCFSTVKDGRVCYGPGEPSSAGRPIFWMIIGLGRTAFAVGAGEVVWTFFYSPLSFFSSFSLSLWETARYILKYCLKGPLNSKQRSN